jgi:site-specific DNA recombinase
VRRIFAEFAEGFGIYAIAERLTADGIPCPSAHDRARNPHRCGLAWSKGAVRAILANPRYTGRQVWNKQRKDEVLLDVSDVAQGHVTKMRWNDDDKWIYSDHVVHPPIVDDQTFERARLLLAARNARQVIKRPRSSPRAYPLRGVLFCGICQRRMQGSWNNDQVYYRCTFPSEYARTNRLQHPRAVYLRESDIVPPLDQWFAGIFSPGRLPAPSRNWPQLSRPMSPSRKPSGSVLRSPRPTCSSPPTVPPSTRAATRRWSAPGSPRPRPASSRPGPAWTHSPGHAQLG